MNNKQAMGRQLRTLTQEEIDLMNCVKTFSGPINCEVAKICQYFQNQQSMGKISANTDIGYGQLDMSNQLYWLLIQFFGYNRVKSLFKNNTI